MDSGIICPCCGQKSNGEFCMHCGEIIKHQRLSLRTLINSVPDVFFDVESGLFYSILNLLKRPGTVVRRYFAGDRSRNYKPLKFVLFIGGLWACLLISFPIQGDSGPFTSRFLTMPKPEEIPAKTWTSLATSTHPVSYTHLRAHETDSYLVCRLLLEKKK